MNSNAITRFHTSSESFAQAVVPCYNELRGFFRSRVGCQNEAEDLAQETYSRVLSRTANKPIEQPRQFLFRVARNLLVDRARGRAKSSQAAIDPSEMERLSVTTLTPNNTVEARERLQLLENTVDQLPKRCREVFILNRYYGLSYPEVAKRLKISRSTVEKHMIRAIAACRSSLKRVDDDKERVF